MANEASEPEKTKSEITDKVWDFNHIPSTHPESIATHRFCQIPDELGVTYINDLAMKDVVRIQKMARDEIAPITKKYKISDFQKEKQDTTKTVDETAVFEVALETLLERDVKMSRDCDCPLILQMLILYLKHNGGSKQKGILVGSGSGVLQKTRHLVQKLDRTFYAESSEATDNALNKASGMEIIAVLKHFISRLPDPLLTKKFIQIFSHLDCIDDPSEQMKALKLLNLQLPPAHRGSLLNLLNLFSEIISNDKTTHSGLDNVAEAMAPFLFPIKGQDQMMEAKHCYLTKMMILNRNIMNVVPPFMMKQIRKNEHQRVRKGPSMQAVEYQEATKVDAKGQVSMLLDWSDRQIRDFQLKITNQTTARDIIMQACATFPSTKTKDKSSIPAAGPKFLTKLIATSYNEQCTMEPSKCPAFASQLHSLFETGGNVESRRLRPDVSVMSVYQENPKVERWVINCQHLVKSLHT